MLVMIPAVETGPRPVHGLTDLTTEQEADAHSEECPVKLLGVREAGGACIFNSAERTDAFNKTPRRLQPQRLHLNDALQTPR